MSDLGLLARLESLRPALVQAAQAVLDDWEQGEEGEDEWLGSGGACDSVSQAMAGVIGSLDGVEIADGGHDGDDHAWLIAYDDSEAFGIDIPPGAYETGGGYSWKKKEGVRLSPSDVEFFPLIRSDVAVFRPSSGVPAMDLKTVASRVAATSVEAARRKKKPAKKPKRGAPVRERRQIVRSREVPDDVLRAETEYACRLELSLSATFEGTTTKQKVLSKLKMELTNAIRSAVTTTARELNLSSGGVKVQPVRLECDVHDMSSDL